MPEFRGTTICAVKRGGKTAIAGDGQVTMGESVVFKNNAVKVRRIFGGNVVLGFAGSVSDAFSLSERFEGMLNKFSGNLMRSAVELAELWRNDKMAPSAAAEITRLRRRAPLHRKRIIPRKKSPIRRSRSPARSAFIRTTT